MKKSYVPMGLLALLLFIISFGFGVYYFLSTSAAQLLLPVDNLKALVLQEDWQEAQEILQTIEKTWVRVRAYWPMLIHHQEMDRIEESLSKLKSYIKYENTPESMAEIYNLIHYIKHIPEKERLNLKNIL